MVNLILANPRYLNLSKPILDLSKPTNGSGLAKTIEFLSHIVLRFLVESNMALDIIAIYYCKSPKRG